MDKNGNKSQLVIYQDENGKIKIDVRFQEETVWLTQKLMAELFQTTVANINIHIKMFLTRENFHEIQLLRIS